MKKKDIIRTFIRNETGIEISDLLQKYINNSSLMYTANKETLKRLAEEFAPIYQHYNCMLDGPIQTAHINLFGYLLENRIERIPELRYLLK